MPKPFNLSIGKKRKVEELSGYVPMAQQIAQFQKRTPDRYHLRSRKTQVRGRCFCCFFLFITSAENVVFADIGWFVSKESYEHIILKFLQYVHTVKVPTF